MKVFGTDYDGVVINIEPQKAKVLCLILNKYWKVDEKEVEDFYLITGGTSRRYKFDYFYNKKFGKQLPENEYREIEAEFSKYLKENLYPNLSFLPGALELLKFARANFNHTFVSSGMPMDEIKYLTELNDTSKCFDLVLGTNKDYPSKTEHFKKIISIWNPDKIFFVADSPEDMRIAKKRKAIPIGALTNHTERELKEAGAKMTCNLQDAISLIKTLI